MSTLPTSNTDQTSVTDRAASGNQPDNTPATGGSPTGGGGGGTGNVVGPSSATANDLVLFDGTTGKLVKDAGLGLAGLIKVGDSAAGNTSGFFPNILVTQIRSNAGVNYVITPLGSTAGTALVVTGANLIGAGPVLPSTFVSSLSAGTGIGISATTGAITISNTGATPPRTVFNIADPTYGSAVANSTGAASANVTAINAAIVAALAFGGGTIYFPDGIWYINAAINFNTSLDLCFRGNGASVSVIAQLTANTSIFTQSQGSSITCCEMYDLGFSNYSSTADSTASCILIQNPNSSTNSVVRNFVTRNCAILPKPGTASTFNIGWQLLGLVNLYHDTCTYFGDSGTNYGTGIFMDISGSAINVGAYINLFQFGQCNIGIDIGNSSGGGGGGVQGVKIYNAGGNANTACVRTAQIIGLIISGCDFNSPGHCVLSIASTTPTSGGWADQCMIASNVMYSTSDNIRGAFGNSAIVGNVFNGQGSGNGVLLNGNSPQVSLTGNSYLAMGSSGYYVNFSASTVHDCTTLNSVVDGSVTSGSAPKGFLDSGTNDHVGVAVP
jgi:hypothetical protein